MPRFFFALPERPHPVGGVYVALQMIDVLRQAGIEAYPLYGSRNFVYPFAFPDMSAYYDPRLRGASKGQKIWRAARGGNIKHAWTVATQTKKPPVAERENTLLEPRDDDIFVLTEYNYDTLSEVFPTDRSILMTQVVSGLLLAATRHARKTGTTSLPCRAGMATSEACEAALSRFVEAPTHTLRIGLETEGLIPKAAKSRKIIYMPRKRPDEAGMIAQILNASPVLSDYELVALHDMSLAEVHDAMRESLIFLSFSRNEGLGLPPIEAMAAECLVVGYSGFGGDEYFTARTGFKIDEGDSIGFITQVEDLVRDYEADPTRLDALRKEAGAWVRERYSMEAMRETTLRAFRAVIEGHGGEREPREGLNSGHGGV